MQKADTTTSMMTYVLVTPPAWSCPKPMNGAATGQHTHILDVDTHQQPLVLSHINQHHYKQTHVHQHTRTAHARALTHVDWTGALMYSTADTLAGHVLPWATLQTSKPIYLVLFDPSTLGWLTP
jgi:ABC-type nickel/cobalt efflux system permease component RcnA